MFEIDLSTVVLDDIEPIKKKFNEFLEKLNEKQKIILNQFNEELTTKYQIIFSTDKHMSEKIDSYFKVFDENFNIFINVVSELYASNDIIFSEREHKIIFIVTTILKINFAHEMKKNADNADETPIDIDTNYPFKIFDIIKSASTPAS